MSIYADKKKGKFTGRFRVEVQGRYTRYRARCDTLSEARMKELEFKALALEGAPPPPPSNNPGGRPRTAPVAVPVPPSMMLSEAREKARGRIWKGMTEVNCLGQLKTIEELMGDVALNDITTAWAMDLQAKLREVRKASDGTVNRYTSALSRFLKWAVKMNYRTLEKLPDFELRKESEGRIRWFTEEEEKEMLALLPERSRKMVRFAILTGGRRGELLAISPDDIFDNRVVLWGDETKSGKSRPILLTPEGLELADWLFVKGNAPTQTQLRDDWDKMRKTRKEWKADKEFVFHGCRHTFAVRAVEAGVPIRTLQQWMGHDTIEMTERYGKVSGKALESARDLMFAA